MDSLLGVPISPTVSALRRAELEALLLEVLGEVATLKQTVAELREEIARLKGLKGRPDIKPGIKPSGMEQGTLPAHPANGETRRGRGKVTPRVTVEEQVIEVAAPPGSVFKGHEPFLVQDLVISANATCYLRERWVTPDGQTILAPLPAGIDGHFGPELRRFVLMQYHQGQSTMPRLLDFVQSLGVAISKRQLVRLLNENHEGCVAEAQDVLRAGLQTSPWVTVDDTGARHAGCHNPARTGAVGATPVRGNEPIGVVDRCQFTGRATELLSDDRLAADELFPAEIVGLTVIERQVKHIQLSLLIGLKLHKGIRRGPEIVHDGRKPANRKHSGGEDVPVPGQQLHLRAGFLHLQNQ